MNKDPFRFGEFLKEREAISRAYTQGDAEALEQIIAHHLPATFFGPNGGHHEGADVVSNVYAEGAKMFAPGSESRFEILQAAADGEIGYCVSLQHATVRFAGKPEPVPMSLRITEIFRRESNAWKLVHRHADGLADAKENK